MRTNLPIPPPPQILAAGRYVLLVLGNKDGNYASFPLPDQGSVTVGRSRETDIRIDDPSISRRHARIHIGAEIEVEDLGSANGTRLRDARLLYGTSADLRDTAEWSDRKVEPGHRVVVSPGDVIEFGASVVIIQRSAAEPRPRKLWSHTYFEGRLEEECARAERSRGQFAVLRIHASQSDQTEAEAGLATATRAQDVVASYGPGEYEVIVVDADPTTAETVRKRVESELQSRGIQVRSGISCYPKDGLSAEALLAKACAGALGAVQTESRSAPQLVVIAPAMQRLYGIAERVANGTICVLLLGETGVGKEVLAERIHRLSPRADKPFLRLNCAAFPENLLESELFGHERGAFTGALNAKLGLLESANGGTVFLDEIGELPLPTQGKLLRVLEAKEVLRVGSVKYRPINVRFVAATNRDLEAEANAGRFREDLYFRVSGVSLVIPPLRERVPEIEPMARTFLAQICHETGRDRVLGLSPEAIDWFQRYAWPGNVRELRNVIERAVLLCSTGTITLEHLPIEKNAEVAYRPLRTPVQSQPPRVWQHSPAASPPQDLPPRATVPPVPPSAPGPTDVTRDTLKQQFAEAEKASILRALEACAGNQTRAAAMLGISRRTLVTRLGTFKVPRPRKNPT
ncbi:MAG TPA: sigma 54-interacting transcriptional regulator [Polyangiaceae bacterium]|nr:sigma 54-interacting transcriptional regulator [Polyangiaceae bacterium]